MSRRQGLGLAGLAALAASLLLAGPEKFDRRKLSIRQLLDDEDYRAALAQAESLRKEWPDDVETYRFLGAASLGLGSYREAEAQIQWMLDLRIGKSDFPGWMLVAGFREATGDLEGALEGLNLAHGRAASLEERLSALISAGRIHLAAGRVAVADQAMAAVLKERPDLPAAYELLARIRLAQGRREESIGILRTLTGKSGRTLPLYMLATLTKEKADCASFETAARSIAGKAKNANRELTLYLSGEGKRPAEGLRIAQAEAIRRRDAKTLDALAVALHANGRQTEALAVIREALASGSSDPEIAAHAAAIRGER